MATAQLVFTFKVGGVLTNATSVVLSDPTGTFGVKRNDTDATVVADGTAMTNASVGVYTYEFTEPATDLTYSWWAEFVYDGVTHRTEFEFTGATSGTLATLSRVKEYLSIADATATYDTKLTNLIPVASRMIEDHCDREFVSESRVEYQNSAGRSSIALRAYPVTSSPRVMAADTALEVSNTSDSVHLARVSIDSGVMTLTRVASGTATSSTLTLSSYATIDALVTAIEALGNGWEAESCGDYGDYPTSTIRDTQGVLDAKEETAEIEHFVDIAGRMRCNTTTGTVWLPRQLCEGIHDLRIDYVGGYSSIPEPVVQATCALVAGMFRISDTDHTVKSEKLGDYSYTLADTTTTVGGGDTGNLVKIAPEAIQLLASYKRPRIL